MELAHFEYVRAYLIRAGRDHSYQAGQGHRSRSGHIARVCVWLRRLMAQGGVENEEALRLAAVFHDVGYAHAAEGHAAHGAEVLLRYGREQSLPEDTLSRAVFLVRAHSNKNVWLPDPAAPRDLVLLMEADLLDEEGAMGLVLDCLTAGSQGAETYEDVYAHMLRYEPARLRSNPMVTPLARRFWADKQRMIRDFMRAYAFDLEMADGLEDADKVTAGE